jgi:inorganic pyrophosphatase
MPNLLKLPTWAGDGAIHIVVETPRGARAKLTYDPVLKTFVLSKSLMLGLSYPYDWGFIPSTRADDGNPLDALVNHDAANLPRSCDALQAARRPANASGDEAASDPQRADHRGSEDSHRERELSDVQGLLPRSSKSWRNSLPPLTSWKPRH